MSKNFAPRVSKKNRKIIDLSDKINRDLFQLSQDKLLQDVAIEEVKLRNIKVKEQVRTKFNDSSLKELAENIKLNGLIQPLVVYRENGRLTLVCGERRYRAMSLIKKVSAPCYVLEDKTEEELMAIQFSENSSREELHYIDKADGIYNYQKATKASERKITKALGISKSEVHRSLIIAKLPDEIKEAAKTYDIEKYVLVEYEALDNNAFKRKLKKSLVQGNLRKRVELKKAITEQSKTKAVKPVRAKKASTKKVLAKKAPSKRRTSKDKLLEEIKKSGEIKLDAKTKALLSKLLEK